MGELTLVLTDVFTIRGTDGPIFTANTKNNDQILLIFEADSIYYLDVLVEEKIEITKSLISGILDLESISFNFGDLHESAILDNTHFEIAYQNVSLLRLKFRTNVDFSRANNRLLAAGLILYSNTWNSYQNSHMQYMIDHDLKFYEWYDCHYTTIKDEIPIMTYYIQQNSFTPCSKKMPPFSPIIIYYDLEVFNGCENNTKASVPSPDILSNYITHCSIVVEEHNEIIDKCVLHNTNEKLPHPNVFCSSEKELLTKFFRIIKDYKCNLLIGFNNFHFDSDWINQRASTHELETFILRLFLGNLIAKKDNASLNDYFIYFNLITESGKQVLQKKPRIPGIHEVDMMSMLTRNFPRTTDEGIGLNNWLKTFNLEQKTAMSFSLYQLLILHINGTSLPISPDLDLKIDNPFQPRELEKAIKREAQKLGYSEDTKIAFLNQQVAIYNLRDSMALYDLNQKTGVIKMSLGNLLMAPITPLQAIHCGVSLIVIPFLVSFIKSRGILVGCRVSQGMETVPSVQGGVVIPPVFPPSGIFSTPILIFDFNSLYPNVIITNSISPENLFLSDDMDEGIQISKNSSILYFKHNKNSISSSLCSFLLFERNLIKKQMKTEKDPARWEWFNRRQLGLKLIANSIYGVLASNAHQIHSFISKSLASAITHMAGVYTLIMARVTIQIAKLNVVGGDTDSIFIEIPQELLAANGLTDDKTIKGRSAQIRFSWKIASELEHIFQKVLDALFPDHTLTFAHEGTFCPFIPLAPKHYCGAYRDNEMQLVTYEPDTKLQSIAKCRGLNLVRRGVSKTIKIFEHDVFLEAMQLNNNKNLATIAEEHLVKILLQPNLSVQMSKSVNVSLARATETQMSWRWFRIIVSQLFTQLELLWPSFSTRETFIVIKRPPFRNDKGQKVFDLLSSHSVPVLLLEEFQGEVDLEHYFARLPLDQFLSYCQKPPGNRTAAKKAAQVLISDHLLKLQEQPQPITKKTKTAICDNIINLLRNHWFQLKYPKLWIQLIYLNMPTEPKFAFGTSAPQMISFWAYRLAKLVEWSEDSDSKVAFNKIIKHPLIKDLALLCICLRYTILEWSSYFWAQIINPLEPLPKILYLLIPHQLFIEQEMLVGILDPTKIISPPD